MHGNHDPVETGWSALGGPWPERVTVFGTGKVQAVPVESDGIPLATVQGISFAQRSERENLALKFAHSAGPGVQVGVLHCNVQGAASDYDDYSPCTLDDLRRIGLDYWALGHVHTRIVLSGADAANYSVAASASTSADITPRSLHVTAPAPWALTSPGWSIPATSRLAAPSQASEG